MKKALIFWGGWSGHEPKAVAERMARLLEKNHFETTLFDSAECLAEEDLLQYDLIVPSVTMGEISKESIRALEQAVAHGVGLAGCHGGMCDTFRNCTEWQFITGGQWVAHPGGSKVNYTVNICHGANPITQGMKDFSVCSEQYYLHIDPAIEVLATTRFPQAEGYHTTNKPVDMPVVWTKFWGAGRVFYCSLGHNDALFDQCPEAALLMERGMLWAADGKHAAENK